MKLLDALKVARDCNLTNVREAICNIRIHAENLFTYGEEQNEYSELVREYKIAAINGLTLDTSIEDALEKLEA